MSWMTTSGSGGSKTHELDKRAKVINYDQLTDLITAGKKVVGMF